MSSGMVIANNISALNTTRQLSLNNSSLRKSLEKLSSGFRINTGQDAPADLIISEQLRAQNTGLKRAVRNTGEAMNVLGIAEGALNEMNSILKKMRELALHAANNGITSPQQVAADQSEMDSGIQTIDRIAQTTKYSDQFLLNGAKGILFDRTTKEGDNALLDLGFTRIDSVFKREGVVETITYTGETVAGDAANMNTQATKGFVESGATAGSLFEIDDADNTLKTDQRFVLTGKDGSREFAFNAGADLTSIADAINNVKDSLGVEATTVLANTGLTRRSNSSQVDDDGISGVGGGNDQASTTAGLIDNNETLIFGNTESAAPADRVNNVTWTTDPVLGKHTDGHGRVYVTFAENGNNLEARLYKNDVNPLTNTYDEEDLIAFGSADHSVLGVVDIEFAERNNSGINGTLNVDTDGVGGTVTADVVLATHSVDRTLAARNARLDLAGDSTGYSLSFVADQTGFTGAAGNDISIELVDTGTRNATIETTITGDATNGYKFTVALGTDADGNINSTGANVETSILAAQTAAGVTVFNAAGITSDANIVEARAETFLTGGNDAGDGFQMDGALGNADTISVTGIDLGVNTDAEGKLYFEVTEATVADAGAQIINVYKDKDKTAESLVASFNGAAAGPGAGTEATYLLDDSNNSGLRIAINHSDGDNSDGVFDTGDSTLTFNTGIRLSSTEYGADSFVRVQALEGNMWDVHDASDESANGKGYVNLDSSESFITKESRGSGATLAVNGLDVFTDGLNANAATPDFNGELAFREGEVGFTTIARVGQNKGFSTTAVGQMTIATNMAVNAGVNNEETMDNFTNGMQFQLGEGQGDQERTIYGIQSMTVSNLGKVEFTDDFDGTGVETKTLTMSDMLGGGFASLAVDAVKALTIIDEAIDDVASLRARIGSFQANLLQTNANNLNVAIENITKTESAIRDADMAMETTDFTKNQIMTQAATSMLAQANAAQQQVLQLLG